MQSTWRLLSGPWEVTLDVIFQVFDCLWVNIACLKNFAMQGNESYLDLDVKDAL